MKVCLYKHQFLSVETEKRAKTVFGKNQSSTIKF